LDNRTLYDKFKDLVVDGPGWSFVKKFDKRKDGRGAVMALKTQAEGTSLKLTRKQATYASITSSAYHGPCKGFTFANYVGLHQAAHNKLLDLDEPVPESKKVTDFIKGIRDPTLSMGKTAIYGDVTKLGDFEECQQFLSMIVQNTATQAKAERNIASVTTDGGSGSLIDTIQGGTYTAEQYRSLSQEEKKHVQKLRDGARKKKKDKRKERKKRKLAKLKSERKDGNTEDDEASEPTVASSNAGAQFGSNGNRKKNKA
jgi:hypothetical protein